MHCYVVLLMPNNVIEEEVCSCSLLLMTAEQSTCYTKSHMLENNAAAGALSSLVCDTAMWLGKKLHTGKELSPILGVREKNYSLGNVISEWIYFSMGRYSSKEEGCSSCCSSERTYFHLIGLRCSWGHGPNSTLGEAGRVSAVPGKFESEVCVAHWIWIWRLKNRASSSHPHLWGVLANGGGVLTWQLPKSIPECCKLSSWPTRTQKSSEWKTNSRFPVHWVILYHIGEVGLCGFFFQFHTCALKFYILV